MPYVANVVAIGIVWSIVLNPFQGPVNTLLKLIGVSEARLPQWLTGVRSVLPTIAGIKVWQNLAFQTIVFLAALQDVPRELYECAEIDGASGWRKLVRITLPDLADDLLPGGRHRYRVVQQPGHRKSAVQRRPGQRVADHHALHLRAGGQVLVLQLRQRARLPAVPVHPPGHPAAVEGAEAMGALLAAPKIAGGRGRREAAVRALLSVLVFATGLFMVTPFAFMLSAAFKPNGLVFVEPLRIIPRTLFLDNFRRIFTDRLYPVWYWNSIRITLITIPVRGFLVSLAAYAFARMRSGEERPVPPVHGHDDDTPEATIVRAIMARVGLVDTQ
jgi:ABC-type sugar transport system permease subunit